MGVQLMNMNPKSRKDVCTVILLGFVLWCAYVPETHHTTEDISCPKQRNLQKQSPIERERTYTYVHRQCQEVTSLHIALFRVNELDSFHGQTNHDAQVCAGLGAGLGAVMTGVSFGPPGWFSGGFVILGCAKRWYEAKTKSTMAKQFDSKSNSCNPSKGKGGNLMFVCK